jgi:hypothetical protein
LTKGRQPLGKNRGVKTNITELMPQLDIRQILVYGGASHQAQISEHSLFLFSSQGPSKINKQFGKVYR